MAGFESLLDQAASAPEQRVSAFRLPEPVAALRERAESRNAAGPGRLASAEAPVEVPAEAPAKGIVRGSLRLARQLACHALRLAHGLLRHSGNLFVAALLGKPRIGVLNQHAPRPVRLPRYYFRIPALPRHPAIAIVTPSLNQGAFIERTLRSVLDQGYPRLEYVVQDAVSTDGTAAVLARHSGALTSWESAADAGQSDALNRGFARTSGEIMAYLNADDLLLPGALHAVARHFLRHPEIDVVYGNRLLIDEDDLLIGRWVLPPHDDRVLLWADFIPQETLFWRRELWERVGGRIDESYDFAMDWELLLRFREAGARFARLPRFLGGFRVHPAQKSTARFDDLGRAETRRLRARSFGRPVSAEEVHRNIVGHLLRHRLWDALEAARLALAPARPYPPPRRDG